MLSRLGTIGFAIACVVVSLLASMTSATAVDAKIGNVTVVLTLPPGYCELDESKSAADEKIVSGLRNPYETKYENKTEYLTGAVECQQLDAIREGSKVLDDFAYYLTPTAVINKAPLSPSDLLPTCAALRSQGNESLVKMAQGLVPGIKEVVDGLKIKEDLNIGVISEDFPTCYPATLHKHEWGTLVDISAVTLIRGKIVFYYLWGPFVNADTIPNMLAKVKNNLAALYAANQ